MERSALASRLVSRDDGERRLASLPIALAHRGRDVPAPEGLGRPGDRPASFLPIVTRSAGGPGLPCPGFAATAPTRARLIVAAGPAAGRSVPIPGPRFLIGRHPSCQLRPRSATISRYHTLIELRDGRVFVHDLGSANGTVLDGRTLHRGTAEVAADARLRIGPLQFLLKVEAGPGAGAVMTEDLVARWLHEGEDEADDEGEDDGPDPCAATLIEVAPRDGPDATPALACPATSDLPAYPLETEASDIECKVIQDILVVTVILPTLDDESAVDKLRDTLARMHEQTSIRRVVVSLCNVAFLSHSAMGLLVAHMLRLEWAGGGLRLCHIQTPVMAVLKTIHLPMLVETYPTLDEAVLSAWS